MVRKHFGLVRVIYYSSSHVKTDPKSKYGSLILGGVTEYDDRLKNNKY
jgi:hypothetical protein